MTFRGQRFELDLDADDFTPVPVASTSAAPTHSPNLVGEIKERDQTSVPAPPTQKSSRTGFPEHRKRKNISTFRQQQSRLHDASLTASPPRNTPPDAPSSSQPNPFSTQVPPSDRAIAHHLAKKHGVDFEAAEKTQIDEENKQRLAAMSEEDIEQARAELMANLSPAFIERLLKRANIDEDTLNQDGRPSGPTELPNSGRSTSETSLEPGTSISHHEEPSDEGGGIPEHEPGIPLEENATSSIHFPVPPRAADSYVPLDPNSPAFLADLKTHYFPDTPHDPGSLSWLQDPSTEENEESPYNPTKDSYPSSELRFSFTGTIIPPNESLEIDVTKGLHHHGLAPSSAGYTIPELALLSRSTLPNQRCVAWQVLGRILFRLGRGDFGPRGSELQEGLWSIIERERVIEVMMNEANRDSGHLSAKTYATEALWLWRRGGGGDRGLLKPGEKRSS